VGEVLDAAIKIYMRNARTLMGLAAVVVIPMQVLSGIVLLSAIPSGSDVPTGVYSIGHQPRTVPDPAAMLGAEGILLVVQLLVSLLVTAACVKAVSDDYLDRPRGIATSLRFAVGRLPGLAGMEILYILGLIVAFVALIVPGIWLYAAWGVAAPALLIERLGPVKALGRSRRLVKGRWWATAGVLLVASIMVSVVSGAIQAVLVAIISLPSQPTLVLAVFASVLSSAVATIISTPFSAAVGTVLYYDLRVRHDGYDLHLLADELGLPAPEGYDPDALGAVPVGQYGPDGTLWGPESVGQPGGPPFWPPPPGWTPGQAPNG
jgi:hypothetical protein